MDILYNKKKKKTLSYRGETSFKFSRKLVFLFFVLFCFFFVLWYLSHSTSLLANTLMAETLNNQIYHVKRTQVNLQRVSIKSASLKEHFFLEKLYVSFEKVSNIMIGNIISFYRIFVLCNLDVWFRNYGNLVKSPQISLV